MNELLKDKTERAKFFVAFFFVGIFNNNGYVVVQASANDLAGTFN